MANDRGQRSRRPLYAPPPPSGRQHSTFGYWVPLITISTIALGGLAAWVWSERSDHDDEHEHEKPPRPPTGMGKPYPTQGAQPYPGPPGPGQDVGGMPPYQGPVPSQSAGPQGMPPPVGGEASEYYGVAQSRDAQHEEHRDESSFYGQVRGALRRTPSPQQFFDQASRQAQAAAAAAGAALGSIMEEDRDDYYRQDTRSERRERREDREGFSDHERWSEEAEEKQRVGVVEAESEKRADAARSAREEKGKGRAKKSVAIVVSADTGRASAYEQDSTYHTEHASILSHLPTEHDPFTTDLFVLIHAPNLKSLPPLDYQPNSANATSTLGSSYSQISTPAVTPGSELQSISPRISASDSQPNNAFDTLYQQSLTLVSHPSQILPFTTNSGYIQILKHLAPQLVYISDTLAGHEGENVAQLKGWVGHTILVAGDEGHAGLADTETEDEGGREERRWWERSAMVGLGKEVEVVDAGRVGDDWGRRVGGRE